MAVGTFDLDLRERGPEDTAIAVDVHRGVAVHAQQGAPRVAVCVVRQVMDVRLDVQIVLAVQRGLRLAVRTVRRVVRRFHGSASPAIRRAQVNVSEARTSNSATPQAPSATPTATAPTAASRIARSRFRSTATAAATVTAACKAITASGTHSSEVMRNLPKKGPPVHL